MKRSTISIKFPVILNSDGDGFCYFEDSKLHAGVYGSDGVAKRKLKEILEDQVERALRDDHARGSGKIIGTKSGEVFLIRCKGGEWLYEICGPERSHASSCLGFADRQGALEAAQKHIEQGFGGVAWIHTV